MNSALTLPAHFLFKEALFYALLSSSGMARAAATEEKKKEVERVECWKRGSLNSPPGEEEISKYWILLRSKSGAPRRRLFEARAKLYMCLLSARRVQHRSNPRAWPDLTRDGFHEASREARQQAAHPSLNCTAIRTFQRAHRIASFLSSERSSSFRCGLEVSSNGPGSTTTSLWGQLRRVLTRKEKERIRAAKLFTIVCSGCIR